MENGCKEPRPITRASQAEIDELAAFGYARVDISLKGDVGLEKTLHLFMPIPSVIRLSVSEAAKMFGVSTRTIRRAITDNEVTYIVVQGRYKLNFESLLKWSQSSTTVRHKMEKHGIGQYVEQWKIRNTLFSPNPDMLKGEEV
jgi:excisionase family DNA binding protein